MISIFHSPKIAKWNRQIIWLTPPIGDLSNGAKSPRISEVEPRCWFTSCISFFLRLFVTNALIYVLRFISPQWLYIFHLNNCPLQRPITFFTINLYLLAFVQTWIWTSTRRDAASPLNGRLHLCTVPAKIPPQRFPIYFTHLFSKTTTHHRESFIIFFLNFISEISIRCLRHDTTVCPLNSRVWN